MAVGGVANKNIGGDGDNPWIEDPTLTVTSGHLTDICNEITISANGTAAKYYPQLLGVFKRTQKWINGRPTHKNTYSKYLYVEQGSWSLGPDFIQHGIKSTGAPLNAIDGENWRYWTGSEWKPANFSITCSVN